MTETQTGELVKHEDDTDAGLVAMQSMVSTLADAWKSVAGSTTQQQAEIQKLQMQYAQKETELANRWRRSILFWFAVPWSFVFLATFGALMYRNDMVIAGTIATHVLALATGIATGFNLPRGPRK